MVVVDTNVRAIYERAYSIFRLLARMEKRRESEPEMFGLDYFAVVCPCKEELFFLRFFSWDAVALAERSFVFGGSPCMVTRKWNVYTIFQYNRALSDKDPHIYVSKAGDVYAIPDSLFPF